jgi:hypothetical protein
VRRVAQNGASKSDIIRSSNLNLHQSHHKQQQQQARWGMSLKGNSRLYVLISLPPRPEGRMAGPRIAE